MVLYHANRILLHPSTTTNPRSCVRCYIILKWKHGIAFGNQIEGSKAHITYNVIGRKYWVPHQHGVCSLQDDVLTMGPCFHVSANKGGCPSTPTNSLTIQHPDSAPSRQRKRQLQFCLTQIELTYNR